VFRRKEEEMKHKTKGIKSTEDVNSSCCSNRLQKITSVRPTGNLRIDKSKGWSSDSHVWRNLLDESSKDENSCDEISDTNKDTTFTVLYWKFSEDLPGEEWIVCFICKDWAHVACSDVEKLGYVSDFVCKISLKVKSMLGTFSLHVFMLIFNVLKVFVFHSYLPTMVGNVK
jgi:hypothetical protein